MEKAGGGRRIETTASDFNQHADDSPDHFPEKVRPDDSNEHEIASFDDVESVHEDER